MSEVIRGGAQAQTDAESDVEYFIASISGLYVGQLDADELSAFDRLCADGLMRRSYDGAAGFLGLAKCARTALRKANGGE